MLPELPVEPEEPVLPELPVEPDVPLEPRVPEEPVVPDVPALPDCPDVPELPVPPLAFIAYDAVNANEDVTCNSLKLPVLSSCADNLVNTTIEILD